jgi:hypothetical protein
MDSCPIKCRHEGHWIPRVAVDKFPDGRFLLRIRLKCPDCDTWFDFQGMTPGLDCNGVACSHDRKELRVAVSTPETLADYYARALESVAPKETKVLSPTFTPTPYVRKAAHHPRSAHA